MLFDNGFWERYRRENTEREEECFLHDGLKVREKRRYREWEEKRNISEKQACFLLACALF